MPLFAEQRGQRTRQALAALTRFPRNLRRADSSPIRRSLRACASIRNSLPGILFSTQLRPACRRSPDGRTGRRSRCGSRSPRSGCCNTFPFPEQGRCRRHSRISSLVCSSLSLLAHARSCLLPCAGSLMKSAGMIVAQTGARAREKSQRSFFPASLCPNRAFYTGGRGAFDERWTRGARRAREAPRTGRSGGSRRPDRPPPARRVGAGAG